LTDAGVWYWNPPILPDSMSTDWQKHPRLTAMPGLLILKRKRLKVKRIMKMHLTTTTALLLLQFAVGQTACSQQDMLQLHTRLRQPAAEGTDRWHTLQQTVDWKPRQTAIVVCDMWDKHWCPNATAQAGSGGTCCRHVHPAAELVPPRRGRGREVAADR
jgi:hypothetical protein